MLESFQHRGNHYFEEELRLRKTPEKLRLNAYEAIVRQVSSLICDMGETILARGFYSFVRPSIERAKALGLTEKQIDEAIQEGLRKNPLGRYYK